MLITLLAALAWADCPDGALDRALDSAGRVEVAFATLDDPGYDAARAELIAAVPCIEVELSRLDALVLHRAMGVVAFVDGDPAASRKSWLAVKSLQPSWRPATSLMPDGHPLRQLFEEATPEDGALVLDRAPQGGWGIDGSRSASVPSGRAFVLQGFDGEGRVLHTGYHRSVAEVPALDFAAPPGPSEDVARPDRKKRTRVLGSVAAGLLAGGAGSSLAVGLSARSRALQPDLLSPVEQEAMRGRANVFLPLGGGLGVAALAVGIATWTVDW